VAKKEFHLVSQVAVRLGKIGREKGLDALTSGERTVALTWWAAGIIGNGGFPYFFEGSCADEGRYLVKEVAEAFDHLGFPQAAKACREAALFFPKGLLDESPKAVEEYMEERGKKEVDAAFRPLNRVIWALDDGDALTSCLAALIRKEGLDKKTGVV